ncbi:hypothetical protein [Streptomyces atratus]|uniref:Uncharacterized protein n=1 Tax=Streptomyces atratus TaxID=1893 RepID=A0A1K2AS75_STRAR|nr:hypothetical protein [Streptomyces atratus]SFX89158.1 hypothetical protein SAMN02787144_1007240 [Streptomyces atratus]
MRYRKIVPCVLIVGFLAGCSSFMENEPKSVDVVTVDTVPPDDDAADSRRDAADFRKASADQAAVNDLLPAVDKIIGDWDGDEGRAFISTKLPAALSTEVNGELLAGAFAAWQKSESGSSPVAVYGGDGKLLFTGTF